MQTFGCKSVHTAVPASPTCEGFRGSHVPGLINFAPYADPQECTREGLRYTLLALAPYGVVGAGSRGYGIPCGSRPANRVGVPLRRKHLLAIGCYRWESVGIHADSACGD